MTTERFENEFPQEGGRLLLVERTQRFNGAHLIGVQAQIDSLAANVGRVGVHIQDSRQMVILGLVGCAALGRAVRDSRRLEGRAALGRGLDQINAGQLLPLGGAEEHHSGRYGFAVSPLWLSEGTGPRDSKSKEAPAPVEHAPSPEVSSSMKGEFVTVRRADAKFSNGHGQVTYEEDDHPPLVFRSDFLRRMGINAGDAVVVEAEGISNEPKIPEGSVVLVNKGDRERLNGDLFAFRRDGELLIKGLERVQGVGILATADNPNFKPKTRVYTDMADFEVIGRAVWTGSVI